VTSTRKAVPVAALDPHADADLGGTRGRPTGVIRSYIALTKPRIIELLLVTTVPTMILAAGGWPPIITMIAVIIGGALAAAGASTFNSVYDRDIDRHMTRTAHRPIASGAISARAGLIFGSLLSVGSVIVLAVFTNLLAAALAVVAIFAYSVGYTVWLKRRTAQNIVWGGAAGCMPVLIGWAAVTGSLTWTPVVLFLIVFWWTPPHYWPLSLRYRDDYAAAGVPMLPVIAPPNTVIKHIAVYSVLMVATSWVLIPVAPMGWVYGVSAVILGLLFLAEVVRLGLQVRAKAADPAPMRLFHGSITYLSLLFLAVAIDPFV
jgi:heme o synthase